MGASDGVSSIQNRQELVSSLKAVAGVNIGRMDLEVKNIIEGIKEIQSIVDELDMLSSIEFQAHRNLSISVIRFNISSISFLPPGKEEEEGMDVIKNEDIEFFFKDSKFNELMIMLLNAMLAREGKFFMRYAGRGVVDDVTDEIQRYINK